MIATLERQAVRVESTFGDFSRYKGLEVYLTDDLSNEFYETRQRWDWPIGPGDTFHEIDGGESGLRGIGLLAYRYYARPDLWWVIAEANNIIIPTRDVVPGMVLRIPNRVSVLARVV